MKKIIICLIVLFITLRISAQTDTFVIYYDSTETEYVDSSYFYFNNVLDSVFKNLDFSGLNSNLLADRGLFFVNPLKYAGVINDSNLLGYNKFRVLQAGFYLSAIDTANRIEYPDSFTNRLEQYKQNKFS